MKQYRHRPSLLRKISRLLFRRDTIKYWIIGGGVLVVFVVALIIFSAPREVRAEDTAFYRQESIVIGLAPESAPFCHRMEDGTLAGFERDLAETVFSSLYPDQELEFV